MQIVVETSLQKKKLEVEKKSAIHKKKTFERLLMGTWATAITPYSFAKCAHCFGSTLLYVLGYSIG